MIFKKVSSSGLLIVVLFFCGCATEKLSKTNQPALALPPLQGNFSDMESTKSIEVKRVNRSNGAFELLNFSSKELVVTRSYGNFKKILTLEPGTLEELDKMIRDLGAINSPAIQKPDELDVILTVKTQKSSRSLTLNPTDALHSTYVKIMQLRNEALKNGQ